MPSKNNGHAQCPLSAKDRRLIRRRLKERSISQKSLADRVGVSQPTVANYLTGKKNPSIVAMTKIANVLGLGFSISQSVKIWAEE